METYNCIKKNLFEKKQLYRNIGKRLSCQVIFSYQRYQRYPWVVYQCARFFNSLHLVHGRSVRRITKYLVITSTYNYLLDNNIGLYTHGLDYITDKLKGIKCYIYSNLVCGWDQTDANNA